MCHPARTSDDYPEEIQRACNHMITYYAMFGFQDYDAVLL